MLQWATEICCGAHNDGVIKSPPGYNGLLGQIASYRASLTKVYSCQRNFVKVFTVIGEGTFWNRLMCESFVDSSTKVATYGHIPVPLVYTQVVTVAIYFYFAVALVGEQWLIRRQRCLGWSRPDVYKTFIVFSPGTVFGKEMNWISTIQSS